jgi:hypothetical protein
LNQKEEILNLEKEKEKYEKIFFEIKVSEILLKIILFSYRHKMKILFKTIP